MPTLEAIKRSAETLEALRAELAATYPDGEYLVDAGVLYQRVRRTGTDYGLYSTLPDGAVCCTLRDGHTVVHRPISEGIATRARLSSEPEGGLP